MFDLIPTISETTKKAVFEQIISLMYDRNTCVPKTLNPYNLTSIYHNLTHFFLIAKATLWLSFHFRTGIELVRKSNIDEIKLGT